MSYSVPRGILSGHQQMPQHPSDVRSIVRRDLPSVQTGGATSHCSVGESSPVAVSSHAVAQVDVPPAIWMRYPVKQKKYLFKLY